MKKITMQILADSLKLSRVTVWKALNKKNGVAPDTVRRVREAVEKLSRQQNDENMPSLLYMQQTQQALFASSSINVTMNKPKTIALVTSSYASTSVFWMRIVDQIAAELTSSRIHLSYIPLSPLNMPSDDLAELLTPEKVDGIIIVNVYERELIDMIASFSQPKVYLDTIPEYTPDRINGDLVLLEGTHTISKITNHFLGNGVKTLGFVGDITYAVTNQLRYNGFLKALNQSGIIPDPALCLTGHMDPDTYPEIIDSFLSSLPVLPDAFICANDYIAFLIMNLLGENRKNIFISGYDNSREFLLNYHHVITAHVKTNQLGALLVNQLMTRLANPDMDMQEIIVYPQIIFCD